MQSAEAESVTDGRRPALAAAAGLGVAGVVVGLVSASLLTDAVAAAVAATLLCLLVGGGLRAAAVVHRWRRESEILRVERARTNELLQAALDAHASIGVDEVEQAVVRRAAALVGATAARLDRTPPHRGELGCRLRSTLDPDRWLIVSPRHDRRPFVADDERLLEALVATTAAAIDNAHLHTAAQGERRQLADIVGSSSDGIFSVNAEHVVTSWNPAMSRVTGRDLSRALGLRASVVLDARHESGAPLDVDAWLDAATAPPSPLVADTAAEESGPPSRIELVAADRTTRWFDCTRSPMPSGGCVVVIRDISAQRELEDLKADFLATVSHELRTPLTPIQGFLQTLLRDDAAFDEPERRRFYEVMLRQSERLERLIKDLLDATSLQDRDQLFFSEEVGWDATARRVVELFQRQEPGREFVLAVEPGLPAVVVDEQRAEQVLSNLLSNAVKYSPPRAPVIVTVSRKGDEVVTTVTDRGPGISPGERERVFERFTRLGNHLTRSVGGAGLGLFIARRLVEGMGGRIAVEAAPAGGTSFSFTLPVAGAEVPQSLAGPYGSPASA